MAHLTSPTVSLLSFSEKYLETRAARIFEPSQVAHHWFTQCLLPIGSLSSFFLLPGTLPFFLVPAGKLGHRISMGCRLEQRHRKVTSTRRKGSTKISRVAFRDLTMISRTLELQGARERGGHGTAPRTGLRDPGDTYFNISCFSRCRDLYSCPEKVSRRREVISSRAFPRGNGTANRCVGFLWCPCFSSCRGQNGFLRVSVRWIISELLDKLSNTLLDQLDYQIGYQTDW